MDGRDVVRGGLACPVCRNQFAILERVAWLAPPPGPAPAVSPSSSMLTPEAACAFLELEGAGGFVALVGDAGRLGPGIAALLPQVGIVCVNPPSLASAGAFSVVHSPAAWPLRHHSIRAAIVGADAAREPWLPGAVGSVLHGLRVIVEDEAAAPAGLVPIARGAGVMVGEHRAG